MIYNIDQQITEHRYQRDASLAAARDAAGSAWTEGRRHFIERALWHRSEMQRLRKLAASRAAGMKTA